MKIDIRDRINNLDNIEEQKSPIKLDYQMSIINKAFENF